MNCCIYSPDVGMTVSDRLGVRILVPQSAMVIGGVPDLVAVFDGKYTTRQNKACRSKSFPGSGQQESTW